MREKQEQRRKLVDYIGNPSHKFPTRTEMHKILGIADRSIYKIFTLDELAAIEREGLELRRAVYSRSLNEVDRALIKKAKAGDSQAIKLCYQRFEDWAEVKRRELTGKDGKDLVSSVKIKLVQK